MRRALLTVLLLASLASAALVPPLAGAQQPEVTYLVGYHALPGGDAGAMADENVDGVDEALRFALVRTRNPEALEARLRADPNVRYLYVDDPMAYRVDWFPSDPRASEQYAWASANATGAWDATRGATSVTVAVLDSGVDRAHEDLAGRLLPGYDFGSKDADPTDECGHGTHVTGTVGATSENGRGVAGTAQATILPVKVLNSDCRGSWSQIASGIRYAADQGARVISMSLGCGVSCYDPATADAIDYAWSKGAILVAAAGNDGPCEDCISFPANHPRVLAVGCTDAADARCSFGSAGAGMVAAPGKAILSTTMGNKYGLNSGTSMSAPHVSGAAALALAANPSLSNARLRALIESTAKDLGAPGQDTQFGHGLLDMGALVAAATGNATAPAPAPAPIPTPGPSPSPEPKRAIALTPADATANVTAGGTGRYALLVQNVGTTAEKVQLARSATSGGWKSALDDASVILQPGQSQTVTLSVKAPRGASPGASFDVTVTAMTADGEVKVTALARTTVR